MIDVPISKYMQSRRIYERAHLVIGVGLLLIVFGYTALVLTNSSTLVSCRPPYGPWNILNYEITNIGLRTVSYYNGCNWISASSLILTIPLGGAFLTAGIIASVVKSLRSHDSHS